MSKVQLSSFKFRVAFETEKFKPTLWMTSYNIPVLRLRDLTISATCFGSGHFLYCIRTEPLFLIGVLLKKMENSGDPDEMAHYEPSHLDLHFLHRCPVLSAGRNE